MTDTTHLQKRLDEANPGETVSIDPGTYRINHLSIPAEVELKGTSAVFTNGVPLNDWRDEGRGMYSANVDFVPAILTVDGFQVGNMSTDKMEKGVRKTFNYSGFDLMQSDTKLSIRTEWNGTGDLWKTLDALWGYHKGRVYLRMKDKSRPPGNDRIRVSPEFEGIRLNRDASIRNIKFIGYEKTLYFAGSNASLINCSIHAGRS
jgi:hypothetical protein